MLAVTKKSRGFRSGTRKKLRQKTSVRPTITKFLKDFRTGQQVMVLHEPSSFRGMPFPRFRGKVGKVVEKRGRSYVVEVVDGKKVKKVFSAPEHLKQI